MKKQLCIWMFLSFCVAQIFGQSNKELIQQFNNIDTLFYKYFPSETHAKNLSHKELKEVTKLYFKQKKVLQKIKGNPGLHFSFHRFKGVYFKWAGLYEDSNINLLKSYEYFYEIMKDTSSLFYNNAILHGFLNHNDIAQNYIATSKLDSATYIYKKCLKFSDAYSEYNITKASAYNNLGIHYLDNLKKIDSAHYYFIKAKRLIELDTITPLESSILMGSVRDNLGLIYLEKNDIKKAKEVFKENIIFYNPITYQYKADYPRWIKARIQLAKVYLLEHNFPALERELMNTKRILDTSKFEEKDGSYLKYLNLQKEYSLVKGNYKKAYNLETKKDLLENNLKRKNLFFNKSWNYNIIDHSLKNLQEEAKAINELKELKQEKLKYYIWIVFLVLSVFLISLAFIFIRRRIQINLEAVNMDLQRQELKKIALDKKRLENNLINQKEGIKIYIEKLYRKIEKLKELQKKVDIINLKKGKERNLEIYTLEKSLEQETEKNENDWKEQHTIQSANFREVLKEKFPNLTEDDIILCVYLYLDKSNEEIASILKIANSSVSQKKYRLKKKLSLQKNTDLQIFLKSLI